MPISVLPDEVRQLAERQYGLISSDQALRLLTPAAVRRLRAQGVLAPFGRNVMRFAGTSNTWRQRAMGVCLAYGPPVALSHLSAARLLGWQGVGLPPLDVVVPLHRSGRRSDARTHRADLPQEDVIFRFGLPATSAARTLVDVADSLPPSRLEDLFDHLMFREKLRPPDVLRRLPRTAARSGHRLFALYQTAGRRTGDLRGGDSVWEDRLARCLLEAGLPQPERQHQVVLAGRVYLLDLAYPTYGVAVEFDGWEWHRTRRQFDNDRARTSELVLAGWLVVQVTSAHGEAATVGRVERALEARGWRLPPR